jgi:hypothetical protein
MATGGDANDRMMADAAKALTGYTGGGLSRTGATGAGEEVRASALPSRRSRPSAKRAKRPSRGFSRVFSRTPNASSVVPSVVLPSLADAAPTRPSPPSHLLPSPLSPLPPPQRASARSWTSTTCSAFDARRTRCRA